MTVIMTIGPMLILIYIDTLKEWLITVDQQQETVKDYLKYLSTIKVGQESFVIRIVNDINTKLKTLNAKNKKDQHYLDRVKQRPAGTIGVDFYDPIIEEIKNLREGLDFPEYLAIKDLPPLLYKLEAY